MSKLEREIKVLNIDVETLRNKLEELGAVLKNDGIQKIYVYDLPSIYARFSDCMMQLENGTKPYNIEICRNKLKTLFTEIDNLMTSKQQENMLESIGYKYLSEVLSNTDDIKLKDILCTSAVRKMIKTFDINPNKWIRVRETDGKTTITVKHILNEKLQAEYGTNMQPVLETEMEVPSIESANAILEQLGFAYRNYQEKKRVSYNLDGTEIEIDTWPLIPPYLEIEGQSDEQIYQVIKKLGLLDKETISCNTAEVYQKYGIDIYEYRELRFNQKDKELKNVTKNKNKRSICWNITSRCNEKCEFCYRILTDKENSIEKNRKILELLTKLSVNKISWTGGEALLYPNLLELLKIAKSNGIINNILTNGKILSKEKILELEQYVDYITLSYDSENDETYEKMGRGKTHGKKIIEILDFIQNNNIDIKIKINTLVSKLNIEEIENIGKTLTKYKIERWKLFKFIPLRNKSIHNSDKFIISNKEFYNTVSKIKKLYGNKININECNEGEIQNNYLLINSIGDFIITEDLKDKKIFNIDNNNVEILKKYL